MSISDLPLSYCTNVHPGRTLDEVIDNLDKYAVPVAERYGRPMGVGLWFANSVFTDMSAKSLSRLCVALQKRNLGCHTLNAFPYGDFHARRVKERVYEPDWSTEDRSRYSVMAYVVLRNLLLPGSEGSISTLPIGFKRSEQDGRSLWEAGLAGIDALTIASEEERLQSAQDEPNPIRFAIEPEPCCVIETTDEAIRFFKQLWRLSHLRSHRELARNHVGLCYDICHQAVEFEDAAESIAKIDAAGIRINKVQISNAIEVIAPGSNEAARVALRDYVDERYLHQTFGLMPDGSVMRVTDLTHEFLDDPGPMLDAVKWRIHYHVPVNERQIGALGTTHGEVRKALEAIAKLDYAPHLEIETYTWSVMPGESVDLVAGLAAEMTATAVLLDELCGTSG